jgi:hypothetical protein
LGRFIRFDPADLDAFAEAKERLTGPDPALVTQVWRRSRGLSWWPIVSIFRFEPQARVRALAGPVPDRSAETFANKGLLPGVIL